MPDNQGLVESQLAGLESSNPNLASLISQMAKDLYGLERQINPPVIQSSNLNPGGNVVTVDPPTNFAAIVFSTIIRLSWTPSSSDIILYQLRLGSSYNSAVILLTTANLSADIDPITRAIATGASYTFWITASDSLGNVSVPVSVVITVPVISAPVITPTILQNNVILGWTIPTSLFAIDHYLITRNGASYGISSGTFAVIFELSAGTYTYSVQAVDIVGNIGIASPTISMTLSAPTDYITQGTILSTLNGSKVNCIIDANTSKLLAPVNTALTWAQHFSTNSWAKIQDQIDAGYPLYAEPSETTATYTETFDFGGVFNNVIVSLNYNTILIVGTVTINFTIAVSTDNITFDTPQSGTTRFATSLRYAKIVATFTPGVAGKSLVDFYNFTCNLNVHQETDSGTVSAVGSDATGTVITFAKAFKIVNSITAVTKQTSTRWVVVNYDFTTLNPTTFKVLVFDNAGVRQTETVAWIAKGTL